MAGGYQPAAADHWAQGPTPPTRSTVMWATYPAGGLSIKGNVEQLRRAAFGHPGAPVKPIAFFPAVSTESDTRGSRRRFRIFRVKPIEV